MSKSRRILCGILCLLLAIPLAGVNAETENDEAEQGLEEIQPLMEMSDISDTEGMSLEEMTDAFSESAMSEYYDGATGFSMQYPVGFLFSEGGNGTSASTADGSATLMIDNMPNQGGLSEENLIEAIRLEIPDTEPQKNEQNGCLRYDRTDEDGQTGQTDLYLLTEHSFHHIVLRYPAAEKDRYFTYIEYMINTMETSATDLG